LRRANIARSIVRAKWKDAELYDLTAESTYPEGVDDPDLMKNLTVTFRSTEAGGSVEMVSTGGDFGKPETRGRIMGNSNVGWPVPMTAVNACDFVRANGYNELFDSANLLKPQNLSAFNDVYWVFRMKSGKDIWVAPSGKVSEGAPRKAQSG
jgi:hypothetical protein